MTEAATTAAATTAATTTAATTTATTTTTEPWFKGADEATIGHLQAHGWDKKTASEAAIEAAKSHFNLQKLQGVPADKLARIPDPTDAAGWQAFWGKLGVPADKKGYDFKAVKFANGDELDTGFQEWLQDRAASLHLRPTDALQLAQDLVKRMDGDDAQEAAANTTKLAAEKAELEKDWGGPPGTPKFDANMWAARQTAMKLGVDPAAVEALQKMDGVGYAKVMQMFRKIATATGEAEFITGTGEKPNTAYMTRTEAMARKTMLLNDAAWVTRYTSGDAVALQEMTNLLAIEAGARK